MCGIAGCIGDSNTELMATMLSKIAHRGPDDEGIVSLPDAESGRGAMLGHSRLSILDLSASGHQPMSDSTQKIWISYNGEIYNFRAIRAKLEKLGYSFFSETDTEVIVHGFLEWGI